MKNRIHLLMAIVALLLCLSGCQTRSATATPSQPPTAGTVEEERATAIPPAPTTVPASVVPRLGAELELRGDSDTIIGLTWDAGVRWIRHPIRWDQIEPARTDPPTYRLRNLDRTLADLTEQGFQVIMLIRDVPAWAAEDPCAPFDAEALAAWGDLLDALAQQYADDPYNISHWEIFNEPDNRQSTFSSQGGCMGDHPEAYAELLKVASQRLKDADPDATVIFGGVALEKLDGDPFNLTFLQETLAAGAGPYFDWMSLHYYPAFEGNWGKFGRGIEGKAAYVRGLMEKAGVDKPVVCTEVGQPSAGPPAEGYSETLAAHEVFRNLTRAYAADMPVVIWHRLQDRAADTRLYGLINADGEPKAAYHAYQILANALNNATFIAPLSKAETGSSRLEAYHFEATDGTDLLVAWRTNSGKALTLPVEAGSVRVLDAEGNERSIQDGGADDGDQTAGVIGVPVSNVPVVILLQ